MDIRDLEQDVIKLSRKHNLTQAEVKKIWNYQFKRIMQLIKEDKEYDIKVKGLGTFEFNPYALKKILENKNKEKDE